MSFVYTAAFEVAIDGRIQYSLMMSSSIVQFTTRARVVDLLGREQIADAPTAMGEIFKNAMDAGASNVWVDYWPKERCLIVKDDGLGMRTKEELLGKWLVLATDSKQQALDPSSSWLEFATAQQKELLTLGKAFGKKGIGRLAIGLLGGATVVWTRWGKGPKTQRTLMLVHWSVFRHPFLTLDDIEIPMVTLNRKATTADVTVLLNQAKEWVKTSAAFKKGLPKSLGLQIDLELNESFPRALKTPIDFAESSGTQFIILGSDDMVANHFEGWLGTKEFWGDDELEDSEGPKAYVAFCNPFTKQGDPRLRIHLAESGKEMPLSKANFWTLHDLKRADHSLNLLVSDSGFVTGTVRRFDEKIDFEWQIPKLPSRTKWPGKYHIQLGMVEGENGASKLPPEEHAFFTKRLNAFGGFYVYMDDVRVCPYGRDNEDFVEFEKRRTLNAGRHFFSHRRMFGGVVLTQTENPDLVEKAGREGFQQNGAYRGLVFSLKTLFVELAASYYGSSANREDKKQKKKEKERQKREERQKRMREDFLRQFSLSRKVLPSIIEKFQAHEQEVSQIVTKAERSKSHQSLGHARQAQNEIREHYERLWDEMVTSSPLEFELSQVEMQALDSYLNKHADADRDAKTALSKLAARIDAISTKIEQASARKQAGRKLLDEARSRFTSELYDAVEPVLAAVEHLKKSIQHKPLEDLAELDAVVLDSKDSEASGLNLALIEEAIATQSRILQDKHLPFYLKVRQQLNTLSEGDSDALEASDLREELRHQKEREAHLMELAQYGLVMETADHDFNSMVGNATKAVVDIEKACPPAARVKVKILVLRGF